MAFARTKRITGLLLASVALAGCTGSGSTSTQPAVVEANTLPAQYPLLIAKYLLTELKDRADFHGALIAEPAIKPVGTSSRYVVCLRLNGHNQRKDKVIVFLYGSVAQFVTPTPEQCGDAQFRPFSELDAVAPG
jgi:hypothetical protein